VSGYPVEYRAPVKVDRPSAPAYVPPFSAEAPAVKEGFMARVTVEDCLPMVDNRFALVLLATKRTRQLMAGARPLMGNQKNKPPVLSLREIATGKVRFDRSVRDALSGKFDKEKATIPAGQTRTLR
jgi:DNA-directed RNA polymerase subunit omega